MQTLYYERQVLDLRRLEYRSRSFLFDLEFVTDQGVRPTNHHRRVENRQNHKWMGSSRHFEANVGHHRRDEFTCNGGFGRPNRRQIQSSPLGQDKSLLFEIVVDRIWHLLIKINSFDSKFKYGKRVGTTLRTGTTRTTPLQQTHHLL